MVAILNLTISKTLFLSIVQYGMNLYIFCYSIYIFTSMILSFKKHPILQLVNDHLVEYPTPSNISLFWNYGFLAGMCLAIQLITGIALAMHYTPHIDLAFLSTEHIMRDVNNG